MGRGELLDLQFSIHTRGGVEKENRKRMNQEGKKHRFRLEGVGTTKCSLKEKSRHEQRVWKIRSTVEAHFGKRRELSTLSNVLVDHFLSVFLHITHLFPFENLFPFVETCWLGMALA